MDIGQWAQSLAVPDFAMEFSTCRFSSILYPHPATARSFRTTSNNNTRENKHKRKVSEIPRTHRWAESQNKSYCTKRPREQQNTRGMREHCVELAPYSKGLLCEIRQVNFSTLSHHAEPRRIPIRSVRLVKVKKHSAHDTRMCTESLYRELRAVVFGCLTIEMAIYH